MTPLFLFCAKSSRFPSAIKVDMDSGYLKTPPGLLTSISVITNALAFICVFISENKDSIHGGFLIGVSILGFLVSIVFIACHIVQVHTSYLVSVD